MFVFDRDILDGLPAEDRRMAFIHHSVFELQQALMQQRGGLIVRYRTHFIARPPSRGRAREMPGGTISLTNQEAHAGDRE